MTKQDILSLVLIGIRTVYRVLMGAGEPLCLVLSGKYEFHLLARRGDDACRQLPARGQSARVNLASRSVEVRVENPFHILRPP